MLYQGHTTQLNSEGVDNDNWITMFITEIKFPCSVADALWAGQTDASNDHINHVPKPLITQSFDVLVLQLQTQL